MSKTKIQSFDEIIKGFKKKEFAPVYFLHGEEPYYIDEVCNYVEDHVLNDMEKAFNFIALYGKDVDHIAVIDQVRRYPVMAERQVVLLKEAQQMKDLDALEKYASNPLNTTLLVIAHKHSKFDARKKLLKAIEAGGGVVYESKRIYDNQVPEWITDYLTGKQLKINDQAAHLLAEFLGTDLGKVVNELEKLAIGMKPGEEITTERIEANVGLSKDFNVFELQRALAEKDMLKSNTIVNHFASNLRENPLIKVIASLYGFFSSLYVAQFYRNASEKEQVGALFMPEASEDQLNAAYKKMSWKLKDFRIALKHYNLPQTEAAIAALREFDLKGKGVNSDGTSEGELMREMVWKILHS